MSEDLKAKSDREHEAWVVQRARQCNRCEAAPKATWVSWKKGCITACFGYCNNCTNDIRRENRVGPKKERAEWIDFKPVSEADLLRDEAELRRRFPPDPWPYPSTVGVVA